MKSKSKSRSLSSKIPSSSHPEAEAGVRLSAAAVRVAGPRRTVQRSQKPIVSISGHDVEEIPDTKGRAA
ncbi:MAG TPA: hypothetical protein VM578_04345 [Candidatus Saccharimonadales bacterium]|nr:hypothetical protein [Candidatus Saccharimonadales bacterium]